jgi:hypothetical protein
MITPIVSMCRDVVLAVAHVIFIRFGRYMKQSVTLQQGVLTIKDNSEQV